MWLLPEMVLITKHLLAAGRAHWVAVHSCCYSPDPDGERHLKPLKLLATGDGPWLQPVAAKC